MNKKILYSTLWGLLAVAFWSCSDWTEVESEDYFEYPAKKYYASLRDYKKTDHQVAFGWFGNWTGRGASMVNSLMGLPDSVDFVSVWGNWHTLDEHRMADKKQVKEQKGTRALICFIIQDIGAQITPVEYKDKPNEYWGFDPENTAADNARNLAAVEKYALAICDTIIKYDYDGFDIDYEPNFGHRGNMSGNDAYMLHFIKTLSKHMGPKSGTNRLLVIDGEPQSIVAESGPYFDYFIVQAYQATSDSNLDGRLSSTIENFQGFLSPEEVAKKYIVTENFESYASTGGVDYTDRYGNKMQSLAGMACWTPFVNGKAVRKGGIGTYHMEYDYPTTPVEYKYLREAIRIMNPAVN